MTSRFITLVALTMIFTGIACADELTFTWKFTAVHAYDGGDSCSFEIKRPIGEGQYSSYGSSLDGEIVRRLARQFNVSQLEGLIGKEIDLGKYPVNLDIERWLISREHPRYWLAWPTDQVVRTLAAEALAQGKQPSFHSLDYGFIFSEDIANAFRTVFLFQPSGGADKTWLRLFDEEINQLSRGRAHLVPASREEEASFPYPRREGEAFLLLTVNGTRHRIIMGSSARPIVFVGENPDIY